MTSRDRPRERGGHASSDTTMNELAPPPELFMQQDVRRDAVTDADRMVAWLREAMDAATKDAEAAAARAWSPHWEYDELVHEIRDLNNGNTLATIYHPEIGSYVAANSPAAVLRRIAADRKMLDECVAAFDWDNWGAASLARTAIRNLAEGYGWKEDQ